jgi:Protein of unknown function (DUF2961)
MLLRSLVVAVLATVLLLVACKGASPLPADAGGPHGDSDAGDSAAAVVTLPSLLDEMVDLELLARAPAPFYRTQLASSHDPAAVSPADPTTWFADDDSGHFIRTEMHDGRTEYVMLDAVGPGALVRLWAANPAGTLRVYVDGAATPVVEAPMADVLSGLVAPFVPPFATVTAQGYNLYFPIAYQTHCEVTTDVGSSGLFYQVDYRLYAAGTAVTSYGPAVVADAQDAITSVAAQLLVGPATADAGVTMVLPFADASAGAVTATVQALPGGGVVRSLELRVSGADPEVLRSTQLAVTFDGEPTIEAPVGDFFGTGPGANAYDSFPVSVEADGTLVSRWPMPFQEQAVITLRAAGGTPEATGTIVLGARAWDADSYHFHARWRDSGVLETKTPREWTLATLHGSGVYVGTVLDVANAGRKWWGEGDDQVYLDGETHPSSFGTGTEDYFGFAYCSSQTFAAPYHDQTLVGGPESFGLSSMNRWHVLDAMPYRQSLRFDLQVYTWLALLHWPPGVTQIPLEYGVVSYWYATPGGSDDFVDLAPSAYFVPTLPAVPDAGGPVCHAPEGDR